MQNGDRMYDPYMDFQIDKEAGTLRAFSYENSGIGVYNEADPDDPAYEKAINGFNSFFATWLNNIRSQGYEPVRASMMVNDEKVDVDLRPAAEAVPVVEEEQPEQLSLLSLEKSTEDLLVERVMQRGPLTAGKKEQIYEFAQTHPTGSEFTTFLKKLYGYEGFSGDEMGVKYAMFNSEGVTIEWQDEQGETQETKLSWARAAGVVQRLVDEGRYLETPVVSLPEPETDEPLEGETEPYDYSFEYGLLGRLKADCEYFLSEGHQHEKHLWAGSIHAQIAKMRELYDLLPEKPEGITKEIIDDYETRMAPWEHDEAEETQILDEALDAHHGQIDMLMQAVRGELTVGTIRYSIFEGRPHISMIEVLEDYRRQGIATQMLRYLQGQYPNEEIVWGYLTEDGSALYQAVVDEQPKRYFQNFATGKTLGETADDYYRMFRIAAECSMMLNGRGNTYEQKKVDIVLTEQEAEAVGTVVDMELCGHHPPEAEAILNSALEKIDRIAFAKVQTITCHGKDDYSLWSAEIPKDMLHSILHEACERVGTLDKLMDAMNPKDGYEMRLFIQTPGRQFAFYRIPERLSNLEDYANEGCSVRGTKDEIMAEIFTEWAPAQEDLEDDFEL